MRSVRLGTLAAAAALFVAGCDSARPLEQRAEAGSCERCHGFPPPAPHPQLAACSACHGSTVAEGTVLVENGTHMNGTVEVTAHKLPYIAEHSREALLRTDEPLGPLLAACTPCHGGDFAGGVVQRSCNDCHASLTPIAFPDWQTNCTFCHGTRTPGWTTASPLALAAPPQSVDPANTAAVGAHQEHLATPGDFSNGVACAECHPTPAGLGHVNGVVTLTFTGRAAAEGAPATFDRATASCTNYCHGATLPQPPTGPRAAITWAPQTLTCDSCHEGTPTTGEHPTHLSLGISCSFCHGGTYAPNVADRSLHVNGVRDTSATAGFTPGTATTPPSCTAVCHPPRRDWAPAP